jgi:catechol 2,3-dioxygenase-like lactoylglutathione lyase family enzyme
MIKSICHAAIAVSDLGRSIDFYCDKLGFKLLRQFTRTDGAELVDLAIPPQIEAEIQLVYYPNQEGFSRPAAKQFGLEHVALLVNDVDETVKELEAKNIVAKDPRLALPGQSPRGARFLDPDGVIVELIESHAKPRAN